MGIKEWFTRKSKVKLAVDKPKTILYDLYANSKENNDIYLKLQEIENTLNNIPAIPDLRDYAKKNENNNFKPQSFVSDTPWINFKFRNNQIAGSIQGYNDRFEVKANTENLELKSPKDVVLLPTGNATLIKAPTSDNHIVNKKYVDDAINNIQQANINWENVEAPSYKFNRKDGATGKGYIQLSKNANDVDSDFIIGAKRILFDDGALSDYVYRFDRQNGGHSFAWPVAAYENPNMNSPFIATQDSHIITKKALDDSLKENKEIIKNYGPFTATKITIRKRDLSSGLYGYTFTLIRNISIPDFLKGKNALLQLNLDTIGGIDINKIYVKKILNATNSELVTIDMSIMSDTDLLPGSVGLVQKDLVYTETWMECFN